MAHLIAEGYRKLQLELAPPSSLEHMADETEPLRPDSAHLQSIFSAADIAIAISQTNFDKGMGPDGFNGRLVL